MTGDNLVARGLLASAPVHLTQNSQARENYRKAWTQASHILEAHPFSATLPDSERQRWLTWAAWMVRQFHRSSSPVEGHNGCLAQLYHNGHGLTPQHLRALTVSHDYGLKHEDGTTAARRLFGTEHPELFLNKWASFRLLERAETM